MQTTLVVLAAGIGSRYGGLKQMDPVGPAGEFILDYSVFDARLAGFRRVVFVIRRDIETDFRNQIGLRLARQIEVDYAFQELDSLPPGFHVPHGRKKPWGTGHALLVARSAVRTPFAVINADDFYGRESYAALASFLDSTADEADRHAMVGFTLSQTLSDFGTVSRGVCRTTPDGNLQSIAEKTGIRRQAGQTVSDEGHLTGQEPVSMNMWAFKPSIFEPLAEGFARFLDQHGQEPTSEFYLPALVDTLLARDAARVQVLPTPAPWFGVTNPQDRPAVVERLAQMTARGDYPSPLWG
jgi:UTP-glucose-1-phosphate uridylyltransferase